MKLKIYMKSGNCIHLPFIQEYTFTYTGNEITLLSIEPSIFAKFIPHEGLKVGSIDLSQIEAITVS